MSRFLKMSALLAIVLAEAGCGLPDSYFLQPPTPGTLAGGQTQPFSFSNPDHTNDLGASFTGFELYYKFYNVTDTINNNAYDPTNPADPAAQLSNAGFFPVRSAADTQASQSVPLINLVGPPDLTKASLTVQVSINGSPAGSSNPGPGTYTLVGIGVPVEIRRYVLDPFSGYGFKNFLSNAQLAPNGTQYTNYGASDQDFGAALYASAGASGSGSAYVALYALCYGLINLSTPTRSTPVYLGFALVNTSH